MNLVVLKKNFGDENGFGKFFFANTLPPKSFHQFPSPRSLVLAPNFHKKLIASQCLIQDVPIFKAILQGVINDV